MDAKQAITGIVIAVSAGTYGGVTGTVSDTTPDSVSVNELVGKRTETSETFTTGKPGVFQSRIYTEPIHYQAPGELEWRKITPELKAKPWIRYAYDKLTGGREYEVQAGPYQAEFYGDKPQDYKFSRNGASVEFEALFDTSAASIQTEPNLRGVKETVTLTEKSPTRLSWKLTVEGMIETDGAGWKVSNASGKEAFRIPALTATDAKGRDVPVKATLADGVLMADVDVTGVTWPVMVDPTTNVATTNEGRIYSSDATYTTARNTSTGTGIQTTRETVGQATGYTVNRGYFSFAIPTPMYTITSASLFLYGEGDASTTDFDVYIHTSTYSATLAAEDFPLFSGHQASGVYNGTILNNTWNSASYSATWNEFVFNAAGLDTIKSKSGSTCKMAMISKEDYDNSQPANNEYVYFYSNTTAGKKPYLAIVYTDTAAAAAALPTSFKTPHISQKKFRITWNNNGNADSIKYAIRVVYPSGDTLYVNAAKDTTRTATWVSHPAFGDTVSFAKVTMGQNYSVGIAAQNVDLVITAWQWLKVTTPSYPVTLPYIAARSGSLESSGTSYADARNGVSVGAGGGLLGQKFSTPNYLVYRWFIAFKGQALTRPDSVQFQPNTGVGTYRFQMFTSTYGPSLDNADFNKFNGYTAGSAHVGTPLLRQPTGAVTTLGTTALIDTLFKKGADTLWVALVLEPDSLKTTPAADSTTTITPVGLHLWGTNVPELPPSAVNATALSSTSIRVTWADSSLSETGFAIYRVTVAGDTTLLYTAAANAETADITSLDVNALYRVAVVPIGGNINHIFSALDSTYTLAAVPGKPTLTFPTASLMKFILAVNGNPSYTAYSVQDSITGKYVYSISGPDSFGSAAWWGTYAEWGGVNGDTVSVGVGKKYVLRTKAKSGQ